MIGKCNVRDLCTVGRICWHSHHCHCHSLARSKSMDGELFFGGFGLEPLEPQVEHEEMDQLTKLCESFFESYDRKDRKKERFLRLIEKTATQENVGIKLSQKSPYVTAVNELIIGISTRLKLKVEIVFQTRPPTTLDILRYDPGTKQFGRTSYEFDLNDHKATPAANSITFELEKSRLPTSFEKPASPLRSIFCFRAVVDDQLVFSLPWVGINKIKKTHVVSHPTFPNFTSKNRKRDRYAARLWEIVEHLSKRQHL